MMTVDHETGEIQLERRTPEAKDNYLLEQQLVLLRRMSANLEDVSNIMICLLDEVRKIAAEKGK